MTFGELALGDEFTRINSPDLIWFKTKPFTAYGFIKNQNAMTVAGKPAHYESFRDDEEVIKVTKLKDQLNDLNKLPKST